VQFMGVEFIGYIGTRKFSEIHPAQGPLLDRGYVETVAKAHEEGGFDRALVAFHSTAPDSILVAAHAASVTKRLGFMIAHRPGFTAPTLAARQFATLDQLTGGRIAVHIITGGNDAEQRQDGDFLTHDERYARTDEYLDVVRRIWTSGQPFDHSGRFYRFERGFADVKSVQKPHIPVYFGGSSDAAIVVAGKHADIYALWGETHAQVRETIARVRAAAAKHGREVRFSLSLRPILADTEQKAWAGGSHSGAGQGGSRQGPTRRFPSRRRQRRFAAPACRGGAGHASRQAIMDRGRRGDRGARQHHVAGRHRRTGRRCAARLLRPRRHHLPDPRLRSAGGCRRLRPVAAAADAAACGGAHPQRRDRR
jgi:alkanesulfonate monooxygenase SsuD/methylene tetrahydromethanopterin reductase-like flavin-dependent oxidoreductase (luciferase family)